MAGWSLNKKGQSVMEIVISIAVFAVLASGLIMLVLNPLASTASAAGFTKATFLATQGLEAARSIKENSWTALAFGQHGLVRDGSGNWLFSGVDDMTDGVYVRTLSVTSIERDGGGNVVPSGGTFDPRTKKATVTVTWSSGLLPIPRSVTRSSYLTDWAVYEWHQTTDADFGGGLQFLDTSIVGTSSAAYLSLSIGSKDWTPRNNTPILHTTDEDWSGQTGSSTTTHDTQLEFDSGAYSATQYDVGNSWVELTAAGQIAGTGTYASPIDGATTTSSWDSVSWLPQRPVGKQLPGSGASETGYPVGAAVMTGNVGLWHLNENAAATSFADASGQGNAGACTGTACPTAGAIGKFAKGAVFDGSTDVVTVSDAAALDVSSQVTVEAWVNAAGNGAATGTIVPAAIDTLDFSAIGMEPSAVKVVGATDVYAVAYRGGGDDGFISTFAVDTNGQIGAAAISTLEFDVGNGLNPDLVYVSGTTYAIAYTGVSNDGFIETVSISATGVISAIAGNLEYDTTNGGDPKIIQVSGSVYAIAYIDSGSDLTIRAVNITAAGVATSLSGTLVVDTNNAADPDFLNVSGTTYAIAYSGNGAGIVETVTINAAGTSVTAIAGNLTFGATGADPDIVNVSGTTYAIAHTGVSGDGFVETVSISAAGAVTAIAGNLEFDPVDALNASIVKVENDLYAVAYRSTNDDGFLKTFTVSAAGAVSSVISTYEFDAVDGWEPYILRVDEGIFLIPYRTTANVGRAVTIEIATARNRGIVKPGAYGLWATSSTINGFVNGTTISGALSAGWHHAMMTFDSALGTNQLKLYVDGLLLTQSSLAGTVVTNARDLKIGKFNQATLDEAAVYARALSLTEALDRYKRGVSRLLFQVRSCDDAACVGEGFVGPDGGPSSYYDVATSTALTPEIFTLTNIAQNPYFQYRAAFQTDDGALTPELKTVSYGKQSISSAAFSGTQVVGVGVPSSVEEIGTRQWTDVGAQGASIYHTNDADFSAGAFSQTVVAGSGAAASVSLDYVIDWRQFPSPTGNTLQDAYMVSSAEGYAVGLAGTIIRYDGTSWTTMSSPTGTDLYDVTISAAADGWALGLGGTVLRWNGTVWSVYPSFTAVNLWEVSCVNANNCWISGDGGEVWYWNGATWTQQSTPTGAQLFDIHMVTASLGWATGTANALIKWNGTVWSNDSHPGNETWRDVHGRDANFGFLAGTNGVIEKWNGTSWTIETTPGTNLLRGVEMLSPTFAFAVGDGGAIWRWEGGVWMADASPSSVSIKDVQPVSTTEAWAVAENGEILHYGQHYYSSGQQFSSILDGGAGADWGTVAWSETLPASTDMTLAFRSGATPTPDGSWSGWSAELTTSPATIVSPTNRYLQYRATFTTTHPLRTSLLNDVLITYNEPPVQTIRDFVFPSTNDGWMVGALGSISRWDGTSWAVVASPTAQTLSAVDCLTSSDCWAVAEAGQIVRWNGTNWSNFVDTGAQIFRGLDMVTATDGWAVADSGQIYRWNGSTWTQNIDLGTHIFRGVSCITAADCWAVADSGRIARWNGAAWSQFVDTGAEQYDSVWMVSAADGWAVADFGTVRRWNGAVWNAVASSTAQNLTDVHCLSTSDCWAVGAVGTIIRWNGSAWASAASPTGNTLEAVRFISSTDGFAGGAAATLIRYAISYPSSATYLSQTIDGGSGSTTWDLVTWLSTQPTGTGITIATRSGPTTTPGGAGWSAWSPELTNQGGSFIVSPANRYLQYRATFASSTQLSTASLSEVQIITNASTRKNLFGTEGSGVNDVWSVGRDGTIVHYDGTQWSQLASPVAADLYSVDTVSASEAYAVGVSGSIVKWNGSTWSNMASPGTEDLYSVDMVSSAFGLAVGYNGVVLKYGGAAWSSASSTGIARLRGVSMIGATDGFAVGDGGVIKRWNGTSMSTVSSPTVENLHSVHMLSSVSGWAVGEAGTILRWNGSAWSTAASPVSTPLYAVEARSASSAWAVGAFGKILEWDGATWAIFGTPVTLDLYGITVYNPTDGWIAGANGMLMKDPVVYASSGQFFSSVLDTDSATSTYMTAFWNATTPVGTTASVAVRTGNVSTPDGSWSAFTGEMTSASGTAITAPAARYLQYRVGLSTSDTLVSPIFEDITVTYR